MSTQSKTAAAGATGDEGHRDPILERQNDVEKRRKKLRRALNRLGDGKVEVERAVIKALPLLCDSFLEKLPDVVLDAVVKRILEIDLLESLATTSKTMREEVVRVRELNGWTRRALKERYEGGEAKRWGLNFFKQDGAAGRADIEEAARRGYRPAVARCKFGGWGCAQDQKGAVALWRAERASSPSEESGGPCIWSAYYLANGYFSGIHQKRDYAKVVELFHEAADERGNSEAMFALAVAYRSGDFYKYGKLGLEVDKAKALKYVRSASDSGYAKASGNLGVALEIAHVTHERGHLGLDVNLAEAARLYEIAKDKDLDNEVKWKQYFARSSFLLGLSLEFGTHGHEVNLAEAARRYTAARDNAAGRRLAKCTRRLNRVLQKIAALPQEAGAAAAGGEVAAQE